MLKNIPRTYEALHPVELTPKEVVAPLVLDVPLELALISDRATKKVYEAMPKGILEGKVRVRSSLYWVPEGAAQPWHVDFCSSGPTGESFQSYRERVSGHNNLLFAFDPLGVSTDFLPGVELDDLFDADERVSTDEVNRRVNGHSSDAVSMDPGQFVAMRPDQIHRRGHSTMPSHFRRIIVFHDLETNTPHFLSPLQRLTERSAREAFKAIKRT